MSGFNSPRFMLLGADNEILLSDMGAGTVFIIQDQKAVPLIEGLDQPYGLAFYQDWLYVADAQRSKAVSIFDQIC